MEIIADFAHSELSTKPDPEGLPLRADPEGGSLEELVKGTRESEGHRDAVNQDKDPQGAAGWR